MALFFSTHRDVRYESPDAMEKKSPKSSGLHLAGSHHHDQRKAGPGGIPQPLR